MTGPIDVGAVAEVTGTIQAVMAIMLVILLTGYGLYLRIVRGLRMYRRKDE